MSVQFKLWLCRLGTAGVRACVCVCVCVCVWFILQTALTVCVFVCVDMQTALYELCWQVVQGNLKLDLAASVLGDMMVNIKLTVAADRPILPFLPFHTYCLVLHGSSLYMFGIFQ